MGGQTIRQLEALLRNGNPEEQEYQRVHGGDISPLYQGQNDNMISSITTLGTPHNGTHASDLLGNEALIRQVVFDAGKVLGNKDSRVDFGLSQWGQNNSLTSLTLTMSNVLKIQNYGKPKTMAFMI